MNQIQKFFISLLMPKKVKEWLNGKKTTIGLVCLFGAIIASGCGVDVPDEVWGFIAIFLGVGYKHKLEKAEEAGKQARETFEKALIVE